MYSESERERDSFGRGRERLSRDGAARDRNNDLLRAVGGAWHDWTRRVGSSGTGLRANNPARIEAMHSGQRTHGNRAVQRAFPDLGGMITRGGEALGDFGQRVQEEAARQKMKEAKAFGSDMASSLFGGTIIGDALGVPEKKRGLAALPFGIGATVEQGMESAQQFGAAVQEEQARRTVAGARDFAGDMASSFFGGTPIGDAFGIPEKKRGLAALPFGIGPMVEEGMESAERFGTAIQEEQARRLVSGVKEFAGDVASYTLGGTPLGPMLGIPKSEYAPAPVAEPEEGPRDWMLPPNPFLQPDARPWLRQGHEMKGGGTGFGWEPPEAGEIPRPYAYNKVNEHGGQETAAALLHSETEVGPWNSPLVSDIFFASEKQGLFETSKGDARYGSVQNGGLVKHQFNQDGWLSADAEAFTAGHEASVGTDGFTAGGGATLAAGSVTVGQPTADSHLDEQRRLGLSAGPSLAARGHWGDKDGDSYREYGIGADVGFVSLDYKTEDPVRAGLNMALMSNPFTMALAPGLETFARATDTNFTDVAGDAANAAGTGIGYAWDWATDW
jgi:hypothetical protein